MPVLQVTYSLEQICGGSSLFPTADKTENMIMNLLLPLCLRVGCGRKGSLNEVLYSFISVRLGLGEVIFFLSLQRKGYIQLEMYIYECSNKNYLSQL